MANLSGHTEQFFYRLRKGIGGATSGWRRKEHLQASRNQREVYEWRFYQNAYWTAEAWHKIPGSRSRPYKLSRSRSWSQIHQKQHLRKPKPRLKPTIFECLEAEAGLEASIFTKILASGSWSRLPAQSWLLTKIIKMTATYISEPPLKLFNKSLSEGKYPSWKTDAVKPIFTGKGSPSDIKNYQSISLPLCLSKIFKKKTNTLLGLWTHNFPTPLHR